MRQEGIFAAFFQLMSQKYNSPYSAAITGCGFQMREFVSVLPLLENSNAAQLLREEVKNNNILQINSQTSRDRFVVEFKKRFASVPRLLDTEIFDYAGICRFYLGLADQIKIVESPEFTEYVSEYVKKHLI